MKRPMVDYRKLRWSNRNSPEFRHVKLLLFWPPFLLAFVAIERLFPEAWLHEIRSPLDDYIPFCEYFVIFYYLWFISIAFILLYTLLYDIPTFKRTQQYFIFTFSIALLVCILYPNYQTLRPTEFARDNVFTHLVQSMYFADTNTNVCPSMHVTATMGVVFAAGKTKRFSGAGWKFLFTTIGILICASTLFIKQHSIIDVICAIPICAVGYWLFFQHDEAEREPYFQYYD